MSIEILDEDLKKIGMILGRTITKSEMGNRNSFIDFTDLDLNDFRLLEKISSVLTILYIRFRLKENPQLNTVTSYYSAVIQNNIPIENWNGPPTN